MPSKRQQKFPDAFHLTSIRYALNAHGKDLYLDYDLWTSLHRAVVSGNKSFRVPYSASSQHNLTELGLDFRIVHNLYGAHTILVQLRPEEIEALERSIDGRGKRLEQEERLERLGLPQPRRNNNPNKVPSANSAADDHFDRAFPPLKPGELNSYNITQ